jgi:pimeloyl-ACP methyl ester carboxylesterase
MKKILLITLLWFSTTSLFSQNLVSITLIASYSKTQIDSLLTANGIPSLLFTTRLGVDAYKIIYNTVDYDTTNKVASGLLAIPKGLNCDFGLINYSHGTTSVKEDVPSRLNGEGLVGLVAASNGYVMCEPDYLGMGDSPWPHYYLHAYTQAMTNIDLLFATREACAQLNVNLNNKLYITGYSQGGFSAMATHKYLQTHFYNDFDITMSIPGAGSYDMSGEMVNLMLSDLSYPSPGYLPFLIFTWNPIYNLFTNPSDYLKSPYDTILPPLINGLNSIGDINAFMPDTPKLIFHQHVIDSFAANSNHPFRKALRENDIYEWTPLAPVLLIHCRNDRQVPIQNTRNAYNYFKQHGATDVDTLDLNPSLGHGDCGELMLLYLKNYLDSLANNDACLTASINEAEKVLNFTMFPNPVKEFITITLNNSSATVYNITITDISGRNLFEESINENEVIGLKKINLNHLDNGSYVIKITGNESSGIKRFVIIR